VRFKILALLTLVVFGCAFAFGQSFGFISAPGSLYCNYEQLVNNGNGVYTGFDNLSVCGLPVNATISGFAASVPNLGGSGVQGRGVVYGDSIYALVDGAPYAQWTMFTKLKCNKITKDGGIIGPVSWIGVAAMSGVEFGVTYGYLSCALPGKNGVVPTKGVTTTAIRRQAAKQ